MFDVLIYLYETYYRPDACPDEILLAKKLSAIGFEEENIVQALNWLTSLAKVVKGFASFSAFSATQSLSSSTRLYIEEEIQTLGLEAIGFIQILEIEKMLNPVQREIIIEQALAAHSSPLSLEKLKIIVLMVLWSQGKEPNNLALDALFMDEEETEAPPSTLH